MTCYRIRTRPHGGTRWSTYDSFISSKKMAEHRIARLRNELTSSDFRLESRTFVATSPWRAAA